MQFLLVQENGIFGGQCKTSNKIILVVIENISQNSRDG